MQFRPHRFVPTVLVLLSFLASGTSFGEERVRPNILVVFTDDQQFDAIGYNNATVQTPNLDRLADEGLVFNRAYTASPICMASRASMMTGLFPQQHGAVALNTAAFVENIVQKRQYPTLPQLLRDAGYVSAFCGKSHLGPPMDYGFDVGTESRMTTDEDTFEFARTFLAKQEGDAPFFLWVAPRQPHVPLLPESIWLDRYAETTFAPASNFMVEPPAGSIYNQGLPGEQYYRDSDYRNNHMELPAGPPRSEEVIREFTRAYYATITHLDDQIGALIAVLRASGRYENTVIVFLSDNGYLLGNHGLGNKITMHEESVRVPMFIHSPLFPLRGARSDAFVSSIDVVPTLLELAGVEAPPHLAGHSLLPLLKNPEAMLRDFAVSECVGVNGALGAGHRMVRTEAWKYVLTDINEEYLFDEAQDPGELENVAADPARALELVRMRERMGQWMDSVNDAHKRPPSADE